MCSIQDCIIFVFCRALTYTLIWYRLCTCKQPGVLFDGNRQQQDERSDARDLHLIGDPGSEEQASSVPCPQVLLPAPGARHQACT